MIIRLLSLAAALTLSACAHTLPDDPADPLEPFNRAMFSFNRTADRYVLKPVAKGYDQVVPDLAKRGVTNFFSNLEEPRNIVNGLLQGKPVQAASDTGRFLLNSTAGFAGILDVATDAGMPRHDEDFGQTLGRYGVGPGWYLMLPLLGPTTNRDLVGRGPDYYTGTSPYVESDANLALNGLDLLETRAKLLGADSLIDNAIDPYIFVRTAFLQQRLGKVYDGAPPAAMLYGDYGDEE